jgi:hypothetical protein
MAEADRVAALPRPAESTGASLELAMDVARIPEDLDSLMAHGWRFGIRSPSRPIRGATATTSAARAASSPVAKDLNVRLRSGWFSDRAACYLAAGRPVVEQDTAFGDVLPLGPGVHAFRTREEAAEALRAVEADWPRASAHASEVARECFAAERVTERMLRVAGL